MDNFSVSSLSCSFAFIIEETQLYDMFHKVLSLHYTPIKICYFDKPHSTIKFTISQANSRVGECLQLYTNKKKENHQATILAYV